MKSYESQCKNTEIIILTDDNINTYDDFNKSNYTNNFDLKQLHNKLTSYSRLTHIFIAPKVGTDFRFGFVQVWRQCVEE